MKTLVITLLLISTVTFSQSTTFVKKYSNYLTSVEDIKSAEMEADATVVFNEHGKNVIVLYVNGSITKYYQLSSIEKGKTPNGSEYQAFECIQESDGQKVMLQLFENNFRIHHGSNFIEFF
jgi:hypothetical protein